MVTREKGGRGKEAREKKGNLNNRKVKGRKPRKQEAGTGYSMYGRRGGGTPCPPAPHLQNDAKTSV